jgi:hypothetical protein
MKGVTVNGKDWRDFDNAKEIIRLEGLSEIATVTAHY